MDPARVLFATLCCVVLLVATVAASASADADAAADSSLDNDIPPWRQSLLDCWTDATCQRALTVSHGGDWGLDFPYDSLPAFERALREGTDAVKGDFRVSVDGVGMVMHSSPIQVYESPDCWGMLVESTPAAVLQQCKMALSNYTFISTDTFLNLTASMGGITMLCIKNATEIPRAIEIILENGAQNRTFLEIKIPDLISIVPNSPGWESVYYMAEGGSLSDLELFLSNASATLLRQSFTFEFDPSWPSWGMANVSEVIQSKLHPLGIRSMAATPTLLPSVQDHLTLWDTDGFDVVYTYDTVNAVTARTQVDEARGISPP